MDTVFDRDTAIKRIESVADGSAPSGNGAGPAAAEARFAADIAPGWRAGRGPHGGYLAAILLRALTAAVDDSERTPRSLTIHYAASPEAGPVEIRTTVERTGRSLSTLSARMEQAGRVTALALAAFSVPWTAPGANAEDLQGGA
jgi:acyl-coenzyme A thioesterase PaaI-like protein